MTFRRSTFYSAALAAALFSAGFATPAHAASARLDLNPVACNGRPDFLEFWNVSGAGPTCYANMGQLGVDLKNVGCWSAGDNAGFFELAPTNDERQDYTFLPGSRRCFLSPGVEIVLLGIENPDFGSS